MSHRAPGPPVIAALWLVLWLNIGACTPSLEPEAGNLPWQLVSIVAGETTVVPATNNRMPTIGFDRESHDGFDGRAYGHSGCNSYNADYRVVFGLRMQIGGISTTQVGCMPAIEAVERALYEHLSNTVHYDNRKSQLLLTTSTGAVLTFRSP